MMTIRAAATTTLITVAFLLHAIILTHAKVYDRCELARELRGVYEIPDKQLATWVCIANYESNFNTSAHNQGSGDHGLFQISELYWCSPPGVGYACGLPCSALKDEDIEDDVVCARRIYRQHQKISGDGFTAWVVYNQHCRNPAQANSFVEGCFEDEDNFVRRSYPNVSITTTTYLRPNQSTTHKSLISPRDYVTPTYFPLKPVTTIAPPLSSKTTSPVPKPKNELFAYKPFPHRFSSSASPGKDSFYYWSSSTTKSPSLLVSRFKPLSNFIRDQSFTTPSSATKTTKRFSFIAPKSEGRVYAHVNKSGYSFTLRSNGFSFFKN